jgi:GT2 family glycosyltransferase
MRERVIAVVVHWRDLDETLGAVASLLAEPGLEVIVVDNGSAEPATERLAREAPAVRCVRSAENLGYAGGGNLGMRAALALGADVVLLFNNDARLAPGAAAAAWQVLASDDAIGVVGAKVLTREDHRRLWLAWGRVTYGPSLVRLAGADVLDGPNWNLQRDVDWVAGCALWFRRAALEHVGLLDERFFAYHEEVDWCARARKDKWRVVYAPAIVVYHTGRGSGGSRASIRVRKYFGARNSVLFAVKNGGWGERAKLAAGLLGSLPLQLLWQLPRGGAGDVLLKMAGVRDALLGRRPPFERLGLR